MNDIGSRAELEAVLLDFYSKAFKDELIGPFFTEVAKLDLDAHMPVITDFWESILFGTVRYQGNVMHKHLVMDKEREINTEHFERWIELFEASVVQRHTGTKTDEMLQRAKLIAATMGFKLQAKRGS